MTICVKYALGRVSCGFQSQMWENKWISSTVSYKCSQATPVFDPVKFARWFADVPWTGLSNENVVNEIAISRIATKCISDALFSLQ